MKFVIKNKTTNKYIGIDRSTGGYPYDTDLINCHKFDSEVGANDYKLLIKPEDDWTIRKLVIGTINPNEQEQLCTYFPHTNIDWNNYNTQDLVTFAIRLKDLHNVFIFPPKDGLGNLKSNLFTLIKETINELRKRRIVIE